MEHSEITSAILEAAFEVGNELGVGFVESVYQRALEIAVQEKGLQCQAEAPVNVQFRGACVGQFHADLVVNDVVLVELKAVKALLPEHDAQTINYLKASGLTVGLLINFGAPRLEYHRLYGKPKQR